jgi:hypothetical protein
VPTVFLQHTRVSSGSLVREQENPKVREGVSIANQSSSIVSSHKSTTSSNSFPSSIAEQNYNTSNKLLNPHRVSSIPEYRNIIAVAKPTIVAMDHVRNISPVTFHPLQFPASFFVTHGISSPSSSSYRRSCSPREFTFHSFFLYNQSYPKVCPDSLNLPNAGNFFAGTSSLSSCSLFSPTRDLIALI